LGLTLFGWWQLPHFNEKKWFNINHTPNNFKQTTVSQTTGMTLHVFKEMGIKEIKEENHLVKIAT